MQSRAAPTKEPIESSFEDLYVGIKLSSRDEKSPRHFSPTIVTSCAVIKLGAVTVLLLVVIYIFSEYVDIRKILRQVIAQTTSVGGRHCREVAFTLPKGLILVRS